jgi:hypothetical protein
MENGKKRWKMKKRESKIENKNLSRTRKKTFSLSINFAEL